MKLRAVCTVLLLFVPSLALAQSGLGGTWPSGGGPLTVTTIDGPIVTGGLDITATGPYLSNGSNPAPWAFYIAGNDQEGVTQVTLGSLGGEATLDGSLVLDVSVSPEARTGDISIDWGRGTTAIAQCIGTCPEPSGFAMSLTLLLVLVGVGRRKRPCKRAI